MRISIVPANVMPPTTQPEIVGSRDVSYCDIAWLLSSPP
jgi:hypothetical protein